jgi:hypothetical protein
MNPDDCRHSMHADFLIGVVEQSATQVALAKQQIDRRPDDLFIVVKQGTFKAGKRARGVSPGECL